MEENKPEEKKLLPHPIFQWRWMCEKSGLPYPWYTEGCLQWLSKIDFSQMTVFEYGAGLSTLWWRFAAKEVHSVDTNEEWARKTLVNYETDQNRYLKAPLNNPDKYDVIVIDGVWCDDCTPVALSKIKKGGYIIIDNYHSVGYPPSFWKKTDELLVHYPCVVFHQEGHEDWKTAVWQIIR